MEKEVREIEGEGEIDDLQNLLDEQEAEELADGDDGMEMTYDCD